MNFSKACEYGIRATLYIAQQSLNKERASLKDIAQEIDAPEAYTAKILQHLVKSEIIKSIQGARGGFNIEKKSLKSIKLIQIVQAIDGNIYENTCILGLKACSETHPCPVHDQYKHIKKDMLSMLKNTNVLQMTTSLNEGLTCLKIH